MNRLALRVVRQLCGPFLVAVLAAAPVGLSSAHAARALALKVSSFYSTTADAYTNWARNNYAAPPKVSTYPAGTTTVALYFAYSGAAASDSAYLILRRHHGATLDVLAFTKLGTGSGQASMGSLQPDPTLVDGIYDVDLVVDFHLIGTVTVIIGHVAAAGGSSSGGEIPVTGVSVSQFYSTSNAAAATWVKQPGFDPLPKHYARFAAGTTSVSFLVVFKGAKAKVTKNQIVLTGPNKLKLTDGGPYVFNFADGGVTDHVDAPSGLALPNGSYTATLFIDGAPVDQTAFTIG